MVSKIAKAIPARASLSQLTPVLLPIRNGLTDMIRMDTIFLRQVGDGARQFE
jgi:hypothetical protein